jgi:hypothetical protein
MCGPFMFGPFMFGPFMFGLVPYGFSVVVVMMVSARWGNVTEVPGWLAEACLPVAYPCGSRTIETCRRHPVCLRPSCQSLDPG